MRRELPGGYQLDDDRNRVDVDMVHRYLTEEAYWVLGRSHEIIEGLVPDSTRVIGVYQGGEQVGFARVMSDGSNMAWLGDVFVLEGHRPRFERIEARLGTHALVFPNAHEVRTYLASTITMRHLADRLEDFEGELARAHLRRVRGGRPSPALGMTESLSDGRPGTSARARSVGCPTCRRQLLTPARHRGGAPVSFTRSTLAPSPTRTATGTATFEA
jgi:hypothetical protein